MRKRDKAIDILKFFAAILITNSHLNIFEPSYPLGSGGSFGDVLFILCSGFTLSLGKIDRFDNWYKRRLTRIFPPVICWGIISSFLFVGNLTLKNVMINGGGWFVQCILIYYVVGFFIIKYANKYINIIFGAVLLVTVCWFAALDKSDGFVVYGWNYCKWALFFLFFIQGAKMGMTSPSNRRSLSSAVLGIVWIVSVLSWYSILWLQTRYSLSVYLQLVTIFPLLTFSWSSYKLCGSASFEKVFSHNIINNVYRIIGGLCYEIYLVQFTLFKYFDFNFGVVGNIVLISFLIWIFAYMLHIFTAFCLQTLRQQPYNWSEMLKIS